MSTFVKLFVFTSLSIFLAACDLLLRFHYCWRSESTGTFLACQGLHHPAGDQLDIKFFYNPELNELLVTVRPTANFLAAGPGNHGRRINPPNWLIYWQKTMLRSWPIPDYRNCPHLQFSEDLRGWRSQQARYGKSGWAYDVLQSVPRPEA